MTITTINTNLRSCRPDVTPADPTGDETGTTLNIMRAWRTEADPTPYQKKLLSQYFGAVRWVWNWALAKQNERYETDKGHYSAYDLSKMLTDEKSKNTDLSWLNEHPRNTIDYAITDVDLAYKHFFRRIKKGETPGFPKFKARNRCVPRCRFRKNLYSFSNGIKLPKIGFMRVKEHGYLPFLGPNQIAFASISLNAGKYWLSLTGETDRPEAITGGGSVVVAYDFEKQRITINGDPVSVPSKTQHEERHLKLLQRRISRRVEGSGGYWEAREQRQSWERRIADRRYQFLHNLSTKLVQGNQEITVIKPPVKAIVEGGENETNKAILSNAMSEFFRQLSYKSNWYGRSYAEIGCSDANFTG